MHDLIAGIDIGGTNTVFGLVDRDGVVHGEGRVPTATHAGPEQLVHAVAEGIHTALAAVHGASLRAVGIGAPNGNYYRGTVEFAPNLAWRGIVPLASLFREALGVPACLTNDANAAAIGEMTYGAARGMRDFLLVTLGTGLGSGFVANGHVIYGHDGFAGELGHTIAVRGGRPCGCGRRGCLETYASATGIVLTVRELLEEGGTDSRLARVDVEDLTSRAIADAAAAGDTLAKEAFEITGRTLGEALADAVAITSPEAIILFGGLARSGDLILAPTVRALEETLLPIFRGKTRILLSALMDRNAAVLGAAALALAEESDR
jgi:glucokinase